MAFIDVKNKKGTGDNNPPTGYTSWLDYWENISVELIKGKIKEISV